MTQCANHPLHTLDALLRLLADGSQTWTKQDAFDVSIGMARGLEHVHACKIVHNDLKPNNILLRIEGNRLLPVLCDFGSAFHTDRLEMRLTSSVTTFTPPIAAHDPRLDDVYRFALTLWCVFSFEWPFADAFPLDELAFCQNIQVCPICACLRL